VPGKKVVGHPIFKKKEKTMDFQVGDKVVHWIYGPGEIVQLDRKENGGDTTDYYVVQVAELTIWVPRIGASSTRLRFPTPPGDFQKLFEILGATPEPLPIDRLERKTYLLEQLRAGTLKSICQVVRDLSYYKHSNKMNDLDTSILERAQMFLLKEWQMAFSTPIWQAERQLKQILGEPSQR
jgi:RNA polymerase-interacting CarD/CdnL/TRCF family regulator